MLRTRRVGIAAGLCCLVAAAVALLAASSLSSHARAERLVERERATVAAAEAYAVVLATAEDELAGVVATLGPFTASPTDEAEARGLLSGPLPLGVLDAVYVAGADGIVLAADGSSAARLGSRAEDDVLAALVDGSVVTGPAIDADGNGTIRIALALRDPEGNPSGIAVGTLPGDGALGRTTAALTGATGPAPVLVWSDGSVLGPDGRFDRDLSLRGPAQLAEEGSGTRRLAAPAGTRLVTSYAPLPGGWAVVVSQPAAEFDAPTRDPIVTTLAAVLLVLAGAAVAIAWAVARVAATRDEVDAARRSLLAVAGHELRTPLTVVSGGLQTLERRWDDLSEERKRDVLVFARRHARRLEHQVERLLFAAQLEREVAGGASPRTVDAVDLVEAAVDEQASLAPAHHFVVETSGPALVTLDVRALEQVLFHLLENAVRYSPAGGTVSVGVEQRHGVVVLTVADEGVGLPSDTSRLFERFGQVEAVDTRVLGEGGLGLGLHIVRTLVERQGGTVSAADRPDGGAVFTVTLPATLPSPPPASPDPVESPAAATPVAAGDPR